jgi:CheY-like chemotaxis protein
MSVLVVDDDTAIRLVISTLLEEEGYTVMQATNGQAALTQLQAVHPLPHLIILDLMMPIMNGWDFLQARQHDPRLAPIPVVVISAIRPFSTAAALGVQEALPKPIDLDRLVIAVQQYCG